MITAIPKRNFLAGRVYVEGGKSKDVIAYKGVKMQFTERDAIKYWGSLVFEPKDEKALLALAKNQKIKREV
jgi:hypothetical protein